MFDFFFNLINFTMLNNKIRAIKSILILILSIIVLILLSLLLIKELEAKRLNPEKYYQGIICDKIGGQVEVRQFDETRVDCLTEDYAIEFDFASKWGECVGQALYYSIIQKKAPMCALIIEDKAKDEKYMDRLLHIARNYGIRAMRVYIKNGSVKYNYEDIR